MKKPKFKVGDRIFYKDVSSLFVLSLPKGPGYGVISRVMSLGYCIRWDTVGYDSSFSTDWVDQNCIIGIKVEDVWQKVLNE